MRVLSGIQPSGKLHIGNYFGAMRQNLALQAEHEGFYFIADYHALTNSPNPADIRQWTLDVAMDYLALGLDPQKTIFWRQSDVPEVTELTWFFACVTPKALLERCTTYKDKVAQGLSPNQGLFTYPVLQAADILIFKSNLVPVGADQKQHLEITRDIAQFFNNVYGEIFPMPKEHILETVAVVPGIDGRKMSKSYGNAIEIFEPESSVKKKIMSIVTDSTPVESPKDPDKCNVFAMLKLFASEQEIKEWEQKYRQGGTGYGHTKKRLVELTHEFFRPYRPKRKELEENPDQVEKILLDGAQRARVIARQTIDQVRQVVGLRAMGEIMEEYRVDLEVFAGPLDLLLYLVRKEEVDIYDIPIARVTEQYVRYISMIKDLDIDLAGDFLVMAATLMEIKSAMLLPVTESETGQPTDIQDPRAELVRQLLEYKRIKDAANLLSDAAQLRQQRFTRPDAILSSMKGNDEPEVDLDQVSIWTLLDAFDSILKATGHVSTYGHITDETPIDLYQIEILHRLQTEGPMTFEKIFQDRTDRLVMLGLFLAVLELIRNQLISVEQAEIKGAIYLKSLTQVAAQQAVQEAIFSRQMTEQQEAIEHQKAAAQEDMKAQEVQEEFENKSQTSSRPWVSKQYEYEYEEDDEFAAQLKAIQVPTAGEMPQVKDKIIEQPKEQTQIEIQSQSELQPQSQLQTEAKTEPQPTPKRPRIPIQELPAVPDKSPIPAESLTAESNQNE